MEFGPILRSMKKNRTGVFLIAGEIAISMAIIINCIILIQEHLKEFQKPTGYDEENVISVRVDHWDNTLEDRTTLTAQIRADLEKLESMDGVIGAASMNYTPLGGAGSAGRLMPMNEEETQVRYGYFYTNHRLIEATGLNILEGRGFTEEEVLAESANSILITKELADDLYPDGNALGKTISRANGTANFTVIGIVEIAGGSWPWWTEGFYKTAFFPQYLRIGKNTLRYLVRTRPGERENVLGAIESLLTANNELRLVQTKALKEVKQNSLQDHQASAQVFMVIVGVLIFINLLGITGLTTFWVTQRTKQVGIRRALGAKKRDILSYFFVENMIMTGFGLLFGLVLTFLLNRILLHNYSFMRPMDAGLPLIAMILLWALGAIAVLFPALRASKTEPAIATRTI